jgi:hypothetical protein
MNPRGSGAPRDSEQPPGAPRSRRAFRWMPGAVLAHSVPAASESPNTAGRNLYARKLRENSDPPPRSELVRWQTTLGYLILAHRGGWILTWHAPWCRRCDCAGAGWHFTLERGYWSGFGFELSFPGRRDP